MVLEKKVHNNVWWLAEGQYSRSRQPSFAPPTARPSVSASYYKFGWSRSEMCFITHTKPDLLLPARVNEYPCHRSVALGILWHCARTDIARRYFGYCQGDGRDVFIASGYLFGISVRERGGMTDTEAGLYFYSPTGALQSVSLHDGMALSFAATLKGMSAVAIHNRLGVRTAS